MLFQNAVQLVAIPLFLTKKKSLENSGVLVTIDL